MGWRIFEGRRTQIFLSSLAIIDPLAQDPGLTGFTKIANNTKISLKMISFSDHYNPLIIDRLAFKTKIWKGLWHFNSSLLKNKSLNHPKFDFSFKNKKKHLFLNK